LRARAHERSESRAHARSSILGRLTARIVRERLKKIGERSGLDPQSYAAHSLHSGFATSAAPANKSEAAIWGQGRWKRSPSRAATSAQARVGTTALAPGLASKMAKASERPLC